MHKRIRRQKESNWKWYGVKLLFESIHSVELIPEQINDNFSSAQKLYEERIILLKDKSVEKAYIRGENTGKHSEYSYSMAMVNRLTGNLF
ncbi:hypothetical protein D3C73_1040080 [compost metagenome]